MNNMSQFAPETALFEAAALPKAPLRMPKQSLDLVWTGWAARLIAPLRLLARFMRRNLTPQG